MKIKLLYIPSFFLILANLKISAQSSVQSDSISMTFRNVYNEIRTWCGNLEIIPGRRGVYYDSSRQLSSDTIYHLYLHPDSIQKDLHLVQLINDIIRKKPSFNLMDSLIKQNTQDFGSFQRYDKPDKILIKTLSIAGRFIKIDLKAIKLETGESYYAAKAYNSYCIKCRDKPYFDFVEIDPTFFSNYVLPNVNVKYEAGSTLLFGDFSEISRYVKSF